MSDSLFTFAEQGGFHFGAPSKWRNGFLPDAVAELFADDEIASVYNMALGAGKTFFVSYKGKDNLDYLESEALPAPLHEWLYEEDDSGNFARNLRGLRVVLGPSDESYWATDGSSYSWLNLPDGLEKSLQGNRKPGGDWLDRPRIVALGAAGNYLLITERHVAAWELSKYKLLDTMMEMFKNKRMALTHNVVLNAHRPKNFVFQAVNGHIVAENLARHIKLPMADIIKAIKIDTEAKELREGPEQPRTNVVQKSTAVS